MTQGQKATRAAAWVGAWAILEAIVVAAAVVASVLTLQLWPILGAAAFVLLIGNPVYKWAKRSYDRRYGYLLQREQRDR